MARTKFPVEVLTPEGEVFSEEIACFSLSAMPEISFSGSTLALARMNFSMLARRRRYRLSRSFGSETLQ